MKILLIQLARFGDICITWPTIKAIRRKYPDAQIDLVVRKRFSSVAGLIDDVTSVVELDVQGIIGAYNSGGIEGSKKSAESVLKSLRNENYDQIFNLSFSPASSFLTHFVAGEFTEVSGYTRFEDGYLDIRGEIASYVYAQVGPDKMNRYHLADLFAQSCGVELKFQDWSIRPQFESLETDNRGKIVVHLGASQPGKTLTKQQWATGIAELRSFYNGPIFLIGDRSERHLGEHIESQMSDINIVNLIGETNFRDIFELIYSATLYIGPDSAPLHVASLMQTPTINVSVGDVSFWETGPKAARSSVLSVGEPADFDPYWIADEAEKILTEGEHKTNGVRIDSPLLDISNQSKSSEGWNLIQYIYTGAPAPKVKKETLSYLLEMGDLCEVALQQIRALEDDPQNRIAAGVLGRCDQAFDLLERKSPEAGVIIRWFMTEKAKIGPGPLKDIISRTKSIYYGLAEALTTLLTATKTGERLGVANAK